MLSSLPPLDEAKLKDFKKTFDPADFQKIKSVYPSPSGDYYLAITGEVKPKEKEYWGICRGVIVDKNDNVIIDIIRNYPNFPFAWFSTTYSYKREGKELETITTDYILVSEKYWGTWVYCPSYCKDRPLVVGSGYSEAFCPGSFTISPDNNYMVMTGCHWAGPWEYLVFSLHNVCRGYLSCISIGADMIVGDEEPHDAIQWEKDKVIITSNYVLDEDDEGNPIKAKTTVYTVPLLGKVTEEAKGTNV